MTETKYKVVFTGKTAPGAERDEVKANLARLFNQNPERIERFFTGRPVVVKAGLDRKTARLYRQKMEAAGALSELRAEPAAGAPLLQFACPGCRRKLKVKKEAAGRKLKCPSCGRPVTVPAGAPAKTRPAPSPRGDNAAKGPVPKAAQPSKPAVSKPRRKPVPIEPQGRGKKKDRLESLSPAARAMVETKKADDHYRLKEWLKTLRQLARFDEETDRMSGSATNLGCVFGVLVLAAGIGVYFTFDTFLIAAGIGLAGVICLGVCIYYFAKGGQLDEVNLANDFRLVLLPFLEIIAEDAAHKAKAAFELDLTGTTDDKIVKKGQIPPGRFRKVTETIWEDPWCKINIPLADGSRLRLDIENRLVSHERSWRNPRGKQKSKTKWKKLVTVRAGLIPNAARMDFDEPVARRLSGREKLKMMEKKGEKAAWLTRKWKFKSVNEAPEVSVTEDELMGMFFELWKTVRAVRP